MENKKVGYLVIGISLLISFIVYSFNKTLSGIVSLSCGHGSACPMWGSIETQTNVSIALILFMIVVGIILIFNKEKEKIIIKTIKKKDEVAQHLNKEKESNLKKLDKEERILYALLINEKGSAFQSGLVEKSGFSKVKVTRVLDRLEGKRLIERKRRGMTNIVILR